MLQNKHIAEEYTGGKFKFNVQFCGEVCHCDAACQATNFGLEYHPHSDKDQRYVQIWPDWGEKSSIQPREHFTAAPIRTNPHTSDVSGHFCALVCVTYVVVL